MVPLRLVSDKTEQNIIFWQNERPSSTRYCRPIRFQFAYETTDLSKKERQHIEKQIQLLKSTTYKFNDITIEINYKMLFTMIDGKVCNAITETTSSQKCFICGLTSNDFNNIEKLRIQYYSMHRDCHLAYRYSMHGYDSLNVYYMLLINYH